MRRPLSLLLLALLYALPAGAAEVAGVELRDSRKVDDETLVLNGAALRSKLIFKVYVGALYLPTKQTSASSIFESDTTRRMELHFLRKVSADQLCEAWDEGLEANVPTADEALRGKFAELCKAMAAIGDGDVIALTYRPGQGTQVFVGHRTVTTIEGLDFANAVLATWIGPEPGPGEDFRAAILGTPES